jgi:hypothetical protein
MDTVLMLAALLLALTGLAHSLLGERLIFRHQRKAALVPQLEAMPLRARHVRILCATWHLASRCWAGASQWFCGAWPWPLRRPCAIWCQGQ